MNFLTGNKRISTLQIGKNINLQWVAVHFATAMGIGTLFVPQVLGPKTIGINSFLIMLVISVPLAYLNHRVLASLIIYGGNGKGSVLAIKNLEGNKASLFYSLLLFLSSLSICIINFTALTSTISQNISPIFATNLRAPTSITIGIIVYIISYQKNNMLISTIKYTSLILAMALILISFILIPYWDWSIVQEEKDINIVEIISFIPIIIFAMNFSSCVSSYTESSMIKCKEDKHLCDRHVSMTLITSCISIALIIMFFSFSVSLSLTNSALAHADKNTDAITLLALSLGNEWIKVIGLLIVVSASFGALMGTLIGVKDGLKDLDFIKKIKTHKLMFFIAIFLTMIGIVNPNIIDIIKTVSGPLVIIIGMLFPAIIMIKNQRVHWLYLVAITISIITLFCIFVLA